MADRDNTQTYYIIYNVFRDKLRCNLNVIGREMGLSGRGRSKTTASKYVLRMYEKQISFRPNLILRTYENSRLTAFFLKVNDPSEVTTVFEDLSQNPNISYMLLLSGKYDFFVTTRKRNFKPGKMVRTAKKVPLYTPVYTVPTGWQYDTSTILRKKFAYSNPAEGKIERTVEDFLYWDKIHFDMYSTMIYNAQMPFSIVADKLHMSDTTVKKYFYENILPCCDVGHYFFPKGYSHYSQAFILLESDYEIGLINSLSMLPCTSYIYPLEEEIGLGVFHEGVQELMFAVKKLEERGYIKNHMLLTPLHWE